MLRLNSTCTFSLPRRPIVPASFSPIKASKFSKTYNPHIPSLRISKLHSYNYSSLKRPKISCFRHEESPSYTSKAESIDHILHDDLRETEIKKLRKPEEDLVSKLIEAAAAVRGRFDKPWTVPWSARTICEEAYIFFTAFWFVDIWYSLVRFGAETLGFTQGTLKDHQYDAYLTLACNIIDYLLAAAIIYYCLPSFRSRLPEWFRFRFSLKENWLFYFIVGHLFFPLFRSLYRFNVYLVRRILPWISISNEHPSIQQSITERDVVVMTLYAFVIVVCAPLFEETCFRGYLLHSLTRYMPIWGAILLSSAAFAVLHGKIHRMFDTMFFGLVTGVIYTRSKNLVPSILLHSLWNLLVFLNMMRC